MGGQEDFMVWLFDRLRELKTDETVFGPYITSILDSDEDHEDQVEGLDGLLQELQGDFNAEKLRDEILERWNQAQSTKSTLAAGSSRTEFPSNNGPNDDPLQKSSSGQLKSEYNDNSKIAESLDNQQLENFLRLSVLDTQPSSSSVSQRGHEDLGVDSALRAAILSQYRPDDDSSDEEVVVKTEKSKTGPSSSGGVSLEKNDNAEKVMAEQRQIKEKARLDHTKKKERDKEDRAKQKQAVLDRKEKAKKKAQKTERKR